MKIELEDVRYPTGHYQKPNEFTSAVIEDYISVIHTFPKRVAEAVEGLSEEQLDTPYRPDGWTIRQVVHHCSDSHMNAFIRHKLALTEDNPVIRPYYEDRWAELPDSKMPVAPSLLLLQGLHARWTLLLKSLTPPELERTFVHPEHNKAFTLAESIGMYAWHCNHHLAHISNLTQTKGWK
ncbi:YfiT family bacillithiol transferase [Pontibacter sp. H259]|uniref:YfiT family bacillithiol transferase n=1 Tax=Pontibacter sp. H259 TaxID=3133421 RepID=UPI0030C1C66C